MDDKASVLARVCDALSKEEKELAGRIVEAEYPFEPFVKTTRSYTERQMVQVFVRDGFIDRYDGKRLIFPAALRLISELLPDQFPFHPHGKMSEAHIAFWELSPTIDHIVPVSRGGADDFSNWVCTSMLRNQIKSNWTLAELGWQLTEPGVVSERDGLMGWFLDYGERDNQLIANSSYLRKWWRAGKECVP